MRIDSYGAAFMYVTEQKPTRHLTPKYNDITAKKFYEELGNTF